MSAHVLSGMQRWTSQVPHRIALIDGMDGDQVYTYGELWALAQRIWLQAQGQPGECWGLQGGDGAPLLLAFLAAVGGGAVAAVLDPGWPAAMREQVMADTGPMRLVAVDRLWDADFARDERPDSAAPWPAVVGREMPFYIGYTSGSSGRPKAVLRAHRCWTASLAAGAELAPQAGERMLVMGPLHFSAPLFHVLQAWDAGATVHLVGQRSGSMAVPRLHALLAALSAAQVAFLVPAWLRLLADAPGELRGPQVLKIITVGEKLRPALRSALAVRWPGWQVYEYYGASELGFVSMLTPLDADTVAASVGQPFSGVAVRLQDGLLQVRSEMVALGVLTRGKIQPIPDCAGWASAGDLARLDAASCIYLQGRPDSVINRGGAKIYPVEVESALLQHPAVAEAVVLAVPDARRGQEAVAAVELRPTADIEPIDLRRFLAAHLPAGHRPRRIVIGPLPRGGAGKVDRQALLTSLLATGRRC